MNRGSDRRRRWPFLALILAIALQLVGCGPAPGGHYDSSRRNFPLDAWVTVAQDATGSLQPYVRVSAPYRSLVFYRAGHRFHSGLEVRVVAVRDGEQVGGGVGRARIDLATFAETGTETVLIAGAPLQIRGDGVVSLEVTASVLESSRTWRRDLSFSPLSLATIPVWIVGVESGLPAAPDGAGLLLADTDSLRLQVTLQRRPEVATWPQAELNLVSEITAASLTQPRRLRRPVFDEAPPGTAILVTQTWATSELPFGRCRVRALLELADADEWLTLPREPALELVNLKVELSDDEVWQRHLEWLEDGFAETVRDSLIVLQPDARPAAWATIWSETAGEEELTPVLCERRYLLRIVTADDRYGGYGRGALSDRGRTFIRFGEPAHVDTYPDTRTPGAVWEVWEYPARHRRLLFFDAHGMGDYKLRDEEHLED